MDNSINLKKLIKNYISDLVYTDRKCLACYKPITKSITKHNLSIDGSTMARITYLNILCNTCLEELITPKKPFCYTCHKPISVNDLDENNNCEDCRQKVRKDLIYNRSSIQYNDYAKELIYLYKYRGKESLSEFFKYLLAFTYDEYQFANHIDVLTFVPIHINRLEQRGFNQSEILARNLSWYSNKPLLDTLVKVKDTKKQSKQGKWDRLLEIQGSLAIKDNIIEIIKDKEVLIVDDIYTTGFTLQECAYLLKKHGAKKVYALTLARA